MDLDLDNRIPADSLDGQHEITDQKAASRSDGSVVHAGSMTQEEFIAAVGREAFESATKETMLQPTGRKPHTALVALWDWYAALPDRDKGLVGQAMRISAYGALFGIFAMIDGVRVFDDLPHGELRLTYIASDGTEQRLNGSPPDLDELHSLWTAEIFPYTERPSK
jgi:hypothetical protein